MGTDPIPLDPAVVPTALLGEVTEAAVEQERFEGSDMGEVERGVPLRGLYPPNDEALARGRSWLDGGAA
jgi:hypothetical protein